MTNPAARRRWSVRSPDGVEIAVSTTGHGPAVVLVHGSALTASSWTPVAAVLARHASVHVLSRRGRGGSGDRPDHYHLSVEVGDVAAVAEAVAGAAGPVHLVGHSFGGLLCALAAAELAAANPPLRALSLFEPALLSAGGLGWSSAVLTQSRQLLERGDTDSATELFLRRVIGQSAEEVTGLRSLSGVWSSTTALAALTLREGEGLAAAGAFPQLAGIEVATQVVVGTDSPARFQVSARRMVALIPSAELYQLEGQSHLAPVLAADEVAALITGWPSSR